MGLPAAWTTACPDWENRIMAGESLIALPPLFPAAAEEGTRYFSQLRMVDGPPGNPTMGELSAKWVMDFVAAIFGAYDDETGIRHITEFFLLISKKNGKSTDAAGIMMTAVLLNWRQSGEFLILAPTVEVANNAFKPARDMVMADPELSDLLQVQDHIRTITHRETGATLKVVAASNETVSGKKAIGVLVDELWLFGKNVNAENMLREATGGIASRPEGFIIYLSTQSDEPPAGVFKQKLEYARDVRDGKILDPAFLPVIYEFPKALVEKEAYLDPKYFYVTNPNLGRSVNNAFLVRELEKAQRAGGDSLRVFLAKHLNVEIGMNLRADRWPGADHWESAGVLESLTLEDIIARSEVVVVGGDGGGLDDLLGMCVMGRDRLTGQWLTWCRAWAHQVVMERRKDIASKLIDLEKAGELVIVDEVGDDAAEFAQIVHQIEDAGLLYMIGLDPNAIGGIVDALMDGRDEDFGEKITSVNQGYRLAGSIQTAERKVLQGVIVHANQLLMAWSVGNAKVKRVGNAIVITKQISGSAKIDPLIAMINAVALMQLNPPAQDGQFDTSNLLIAG